MPEEFTLDLSDISQDSPAIETLDLSDIKPVQAGSDGVFGAFVEGAARQFVSTVDPRAADELESINLAEEDTLAKQAAAGIGQGVAQATTVGAFTATGAGIGALFGVAGAIPGAAIGAAAGLGVTLVQGMRRELFGVDDDTKREYKRVHGVDAPPETLETARDNAFWGLLAGEAADTLISAATAGAGKIVTKGAKPIVSTLLKRGTTEGTKQYLKSQAAKQAVSRIGALKNAGKAAAISATGEFAAEGIQTGSAIAATQSAVHGTSFTSEAIKAASDPATLRAATVGAISAGTVRGGASITGADRITQRILTKADQKAQELSAKTEGIPAENNLNDGLAAIEESMQATEEGVSPSETTEKAIDTNSKISEIENADNKKAEVVIKGDQMDSATIEQVYGSDPNLIVDPLDNGDTRVMVVPGAPTKYEQDLLLKQDRLDDAQQEISDVDKRIGAHRDKLANTKRKIKRKEKEIKRFTTATENTLDLDQDTAAENNLNKLERAEDQLLSLKESLIDLESAEQKAAIGTLKDTRNLLGAEVNGLKQLFSDEPSASVAAAISNAVSIQDSLTVDNTETVSLSSQVAADTFVGTIADQNADNTSTNTISRKIQTRFKDSRARAITQSLWNSLTPTRGIGKKAMDARLAATAQTATEVKKAQTTLVHLSKGLKEEGSDPIDATVNDAMNAYLTGGKTQRAEARRQLPAKAVVELDRARTQTDLLSDALIQEGAVQGELAAIVAANKGTYLTRSYRIFSDPKWVETVVKDNAIMQRAIGLFRKQIPRRATESDTEYNNRVADRISTFLNDVAGDASLFDTVARATTKTGASKDLGILKQRKGIPVEIRDLLGENTSAPQNYLESVSRIANLINTHRYLSKVRKIGLDNGFISRTPDINNRIDVKLAADKSDVLSPLNGYYTTPEFNSAFKTAFANENLNWTLRSVAGMSAAAKASVTVGSWKTHARNFIGNVGFLVGAGHLTNGNLFIPAFYSKAATAFAGEFSSDRQIQKNFSRYQSMGLIKGVNSADVAAVVKDFTGSTDVVSFASKRFGIVGRAATKAINVAQKLYRAEDTFWKIFAFEAELTRLKKIFPEKDLGTLEGQAADTVRQTMPDYDMVPRAAQKIKIIPFIAPFISFHVESIRVLKNNLQIASKELGDPRTRSVGASRIVGTMLAVKGYDLAVSEFINIFSGTSEEEEKALRVLMPPWDVNGDIGVVEKHADGDYTYSNFSTINPYGKISDSINALFRSDLSMGQAVAESISSLLAPLLAEDLVYSKVADIARNTIEGTKRKVYSESDSPLNIAYDVTAYFLDAFKPGIVGQVNNIWKGVKGDTKKSGEPISVKREIMSNMFGYRQTTLSPTRQAFFRGRDYVSAITDSSADFKHFSSQKGTVSDRDLSTSFNKMVRVHEIVSKRMLTTIDALRTTRVSEGIIRDKLKSARVSKNSIAFLLAGKIPPIKMSKSMRSIIFTNSEREEQLVRAIGKPIGDIIFVDFDS